VYSAGNAEGRVLVSYAPNLYQLGRGASWYVDRILRGTKSQELPVEVSTRFELVINLATVKEIGLTVPPEVLLRANRLIRPGRDHVIEDVGVALLAENLGR
jgi:ABC-type uncharacterized transport system substrate-binding protein